MPGYFSNFKPLLYNGTIVVNILQRVKIRDLVKESGSIFYPYTIKDGERAEHIAFDYYGRSDLDWIIFLCNDIIDPVTQWPKSNGDFEKYIVKKYGGIQTAMSTISYYKKKPVTYYVNDFGTVLTASQYALKNDNLIYQKIVQDDNVSITTNSYANVSDAANYVPVYVYNDEYDKNEAKRNIRLIDADYSSQMQKDLSNLLRN